MLQFWVLAALLVLLALLFVVDPLVRARRRRALNQRQAAERQAQNVAIYRERLAELEAERDAGHFDAAQHMALKEELESVLLSDVDGMDQPGPTVAEGRRLRWLTVVLAVAIPAAALGLYFQWGAYEGVQQRELFTQLQEQGAPAVEDLLAQLEAKLAANPDNAEGWFMLARSRTSLGQYAQAAEAFRRLALLLEAEPQEAAAVYGLQAQALFFANDGNINQGVREAIAQAFKRNPQESNALSLLGIDAFEQERFNDAVKYWQQVLDVTPDTANADSIRAGIARAQELMAARGQMPDAAPTLEAPVATPAGAPSLRVSVALDPELAARAEPDDVLFIYARAANGGRMPLAIVRKRVGDLPLTVTLDDSTAMGPMAKLSSAPAVEVIARVSRQGTPTPAPGDLQGMVAPVALTPGSQNVEITISEQVQ